MTTTTEYNYCRIVVLLRYGDCYLWQDSDGFRLLLWDLLPNDDEFYCSTFDNIIDAIKALDEAVNIVSMTGDEYHYMPNEDGLEGIVERFDDRMETLFAVACNKHGKIGRKNNVHEPVQYSLP